MKYTEIGNGVILEMDRGDFERLLLLLGMLSGKLIGKGEMKEGWAVIQFCNRMNSGNPRFIPYEIPEKYRQEAS